MRINSCPVKCSRNVDESGHFVDGRQTGSNSDRDIRIGNGQVFTDDSREKGFPVIELKS